MFKRGKILLPGKTGSLRRLFFLLLFIGIGSFGFGQNDTTPEPANDTVVPVKPPERKRSTPVRKPLPVVDTAALDTSAIIQPPSDTLPFAPVVDTLIRDSLVIAPATYTGIDSAYARFLRNPLLPTEAKPVYQILQFRNQPSKDELFYHVAGIVLFLAFIKLLFGRYFRNIFRLFFQPSFRQKQTREQLMQNNLPSLLLNVFFLLSGATYIALIAQHYQLVDMDFTLLFLYCAVILLVLYVGKYLFLKFSGWVFNVKEAASTYIFVVNLINKIVGVLLLPFIFILAFSTPVLIEVSLTASVMLLIVLFIYRYVVSYPPIHREMSVSFLHLIIYILAFEVLPLLFIYKTLILFLIRTL